MKQSKSYLSGVCAAALLMVAGTLPAAASAFDITGPTATNIDNDTADNVNFTVGQTGTLTSLGLRLAIGCANNQCSEGEGQQGGSFSYWDNLEATLSHNGTTATVFSLGQDNADGDSELQATFEDGYATLIPGDVVANGLTSGTFGPNDPFSAFNGLDLSGDWTLSFLDISGYPGDGTALLASSIFGTTSAPQGNQVPEPATLGLMAMGLAGLGFGIRRKRKTVR